MTAYLPPAGISRRGVIGSQDRRRTYDRVQEVIEDPRLSGRFPWHNRPLAVALGEVLEDQLRRCLLGLLEE